MSPPPQGLCCHVRENGATEASHRNRKWVCVTHPRRGSAECSSSHCVWMSWLLSSIFPFCFQKLKSWGIREWSNSVTFTYSACEWSIYNAIRVGWGWGAKRLDSILHILLQTSFNIFVVADLLPRFKFTTKLFFVDFWPHLGQICIFSSV